MITRLIFLSILIQLTNVNADSFEQACSGYQLGVEDSYPDNTMPFAKGLLWQIFKDGKTSYIYATIHSQDRRVSGVLPQVRLALAKSKTILMEVVPDDKANQAFIEHIYFKDGRKLTDLLAEVFYDRLKTIAPDYHIDLQKLMMLKPWAAYSLIGRPKPVVAPSLDSNLLKYAQYSIVNIKSLQEMTELLQSLDQLSTMDQIEILKDTICQHSSILKNAEKIIEYYLARDLAGIISLQKGTHHDEAVFGRFKAVVLDQRNDIMMKKILAEIPHGNLFISVGASHLPDQDGLLNRLKQHGYELSLIY